MPSLGKDLDRALDTGLFTLTAPFKRQKGSALPQFLYEKFILIFEKSGELRIEPQQIGELRQLLMIFYKFEMPFDSSVEEKAYTKFKDVDHSVKIDKWPSSIFRLRNMIRACMPDDPMDIRPHHASGATADGYTNLQKRVIRRYIPSLMTVYNPIDYFFMNSDHVKNWSAVNTALVCEPPSKVTLVPKDSRGPRIICMEPHERMFVQKGLMTLLYDHFENTHPTKGYVNFTDQTVNQRLARQASIDCRFATIDLKDASDLVSWELIKKIVSPEWAVALEAARSKYALVNGELIELRKHAPMGSALCFPIMAMLFFCIVKLVTDVVFVYGDDLIVRTVDVHAVVQALESYGLVINIDKSLYTGHFRESCGGEYYNGDDISYIKCKSYGYAEFAAFANLIGERFGSKLSDSLIASYEESYGVVYFRKPLSYRSNPEATVYYTDCLSSNDVFFRRRWNRDLQRYEYRYLQNSVKRIDKSALDDDLYFDAMTSSCSFTRPEFDYRMQSVIGDYDYRRRVTTMPSVKSKTDARDARPGLSFAWGTV
jgi:hypothetical protein